MSRRAGVMAILERVEYAAILLRMGVVPDDLEPDLKLALVQVRMLARLVLDPGLTVGEHCAMEAVDSRYDPADLEGLTDGDDVIVGALSVDYLAMMLAPTPGRSDDHV